MRLHIGSAWFALKSRILVTAAKGSIAGQTVVCTKESFRTVSLMVPVGKYIPMVEYILASLRTDFRTEVVQ